MTSAFSSNRRVARASFVLGAFCSSFAAGTHAAWDSEISARGESRYDDNVRLSTGDDEESAVATTGTLEGRLRNVTQTSEISGIAGASYLTYSSYDGDRDLDNEDIQYVDLRARRFGERSEAGINGSVRRDVILRTVGFIRDPITDLQDGSGSTPGPAIDEDAVSDAGDVDAGFVDEQVRRIRSRVSPYAMFRTSQQSRVRIAYNYLALDYDEQDDAVVNQLQDSQTHNVSVDYRRNMSERDVARFMVGASRFDPEEGAQETDSYDLTVGWERAFSASFTASIDVGVIRTETDDESDDGYLLRLRAVQRTERGSLLGQLTHSLRPSGFGELVETDVLIGRYQVALSNRLEFQLGGTAHRMRETIETVDSNDRDYVEVGPQLTWWFSEVLSLGGFYRYRWVDREEDGSGASNAVGVQLAYQPRRQF